MTSFPSKKPIFRQPRSFKSLDIPLFVRIGHSADRALFPPELIIPVVVSSLLSTLSWPSLLFLSPLFLPRSPTQTSSVLKFFFPTTLPYNFLNLYSPPIRSTPVLSELQKGPLGWLPIIYCWASPLSWCWRSQHLPGCPLLFPLLSRSCQGLYHLWPPWSFPQSLVVPGSGICGAGETEGRSEAHRSEDHRLRYIDASCTAFSVISWAKSATWQATSSNLSPRSDPRAIFRLLNAISGKKNTSQDPSFPGCSSPLDTANHYDSYLCSHLSHATPRTSRRAERQFMNELRKADHVPPFSPMDCNPLHRFPPHSRLYRQLYSPTPVCFKQTILPLPFWYPSMYWRICPLPFWSRWCWSVCHMLQMQHILFPVPFHWSNCLQLHSWNLCPEARSRLVY